MTATMTPPTDVGRHTIRVLVVDDHRSYAEALGLALSFERGFTVLGTVADVDTAVQRVLSERPDVVIIDWQLPGVDGVEGVRRILVADPRVRLVMITGHAEANLRRLAALAGASAFLAKESSISEIVQAVRDAVTGTAHIDVTENATESTTAALSLTPREIEVLYLLAKGRDTPTIAAALYLSVHTVRGYVKEVLRKLGAHSQLEAVAMARRAGLLPDLN
jgi:DNA-binding NarL/FixJ family response regulator